MKAATEAAKNARSAVMNSRRARHPAPKDRKKEKTVEERFNLPEFPKEGEAPRVSPMRIVPHQADLPAGSEEESDPGDRLRRLFRYEDPSSDPEINAIDYMARTLTLWRLYGQRWTQGQPPYASQLRCVVRRWGYPS